MSITEVNRNSAYPHYLPDIFPIERQNDGIVEVLPRDHGFAQVTVGVQSGKYQIKIVHHSGYFVCSTEDPQKSTLGCKYKTLVDKFKIVVTDINNKIILPGPKGFTLDGKNTPSQTTFAIYNDVIELRKGQQIRFWYSEDLKSDWSVADNSGGVKFYAYAIRQYD
eukprot:Seg2185.6 transcript_id=Seg2185.6/GoldUCD/mRNA.D3Y31 product="hypothetical protein" protein_id=Seg2185.6/GoldUCD/D3Y31